MAARDARAHRGVGRDGGGAGGVGEDAEVNVPQGPQLGLEDDVLPLVDGPVQVAADVADIILPGQAEIPQPGHHVLRLDGGVAVALLHRQVLPLYDVGQVLPVGLQVQEVAHAQGLLHIFVRVDGGDAPAGGAELLARQAVLLQLVQQLVVGHTDGGPVADLQVFRRDGDAAIPEALYLAAQVLQVDDHAGTQHVDGALPEDAGGHQVQDEAAPVVDDGVAGVVAALVADHHVAAFAEQVHHTALALVAPVDAHDCS